MHKNVWQPFSILETAPEPLKVVKGEGVYLTLEDGREIIDAISSWWVTIHGHSHPYIADAIHEQAKKLEQVIFSGFTHDPAEKLAEDLTDLLPKNLEKVFFSDNGSTAVEVGMKMAYQYWKNIGQDRKTFICFEGAYHGDTFGAMSAGSRSVFSDVFKELLFDVEFVPYPETWIDDPDRADKEDEVIQQLEQLLDDKPDTFAGIIIEPLVQGAGGMRMCSEEFMQKLHWVNRQFDTLLMFDEVMTGFGRTGDYFACTRAQVEPDIICLSKGLTGGFLPMSVTVCTLDIFESFNSSDPIKTFWHGHSYTANPLGCAAANASLELLKKNEHQFKEMEALHLKNLPKVDEHQNIEKRRVKGTIAALDIINEESTGYLNKVGNRIKKECTEHGVLFRPLGNVMYLMPPYCITEDELSFLWDKIAELI